MSSSTSVSSQILADGAAANADQLGEGAAVDAKQAGTTPQGWDAYEVWRRFIKEARARRQQPEPN